jgi:hypothetical protein
MNAPERPTALGIRLHYPHPTDTEAGYNVGGALCLSMGGNQTDEYERRPSRGRLAYRLGEANPSLSWEPAIYYAGQIENAETQGDIESAWAWLDEALQYHPGLSIPRFAPCPECGLLGGHRVDCAKRCPECGLLEGHRANCAKRCPECDCLDGEHLITCRACCPQCGWDDFFCGCFNSPFCPFCGDLRDECEGEDYESEFAR